jgi:hypothetical protein
MTMQVKCPNGSCGKLLTVQEEYVGKKGKCPSCGNELTIPASTNGTGGAETRPVQSLDRTERRDSAPPNFVPVDRVHDAMDHALPAKRPLETPATEQTSTGNLTRAALGVGICCLALLSIAPRMEWIFLTNRSHNFTPIGQEPVRREFANRDIAIGDPFLDIRAASADFRYYSLAVAVLAVIALMLTPTTLRDLTDGAIAASGSVAVGWAAIAGIWQLGILWKVFAFASIIHDQQVFSGVHNADAGVWPGPGLVLGLLASLIAIAVFGSLVASRKRYLWLLTGATMGMAIGLLLLVFYIKPVQDFGQ